MDSETPLIRNPITGGIQDTLAPVNGFLKEHLYFIAIVALVVLLLYLARKAYNNLIFRKYKNKVKPTNNWWNWEEYSIYYQEYRQKEEEKKNAVFIERQKRREQNRNPKLDLQNK